MPDGAKRSEIQELVAAHADRDGWHPLAGEWFDSLGRSGQSVWYEPSDWAYAKVLATLLSRALAEDRVSAAMVERWQVGATELLTTEGARRRARIELEQEQDGTEQADVSEIDEWRRRLGRQSG